MAPWTSRPAHVVQCLRELSTFLQEYVQADTQGLVHMKMVRKKKKAEEKAAAEAAAKG